ncbi:FAD-dependent oxidoreductase [Clostridium estertheticum]|uniref:FAD-dependent oxidoreductase n=1 Tax=Clostridium estertheticum TaxID=238834 RepID=UPI001CF1E6D4|nr:FAD-dependent oxidoreductase [Clostridium estertheticum]MCB2357226.1 FAD-dependent oxidoreductase [Clostridium estertheticum]WAG40409.1 FAD-dependent oxidoreductase [Clostridium estertheticum]
MREFETDVVVIGGGASGLAAAITAAEKGAQVMILEKANSTGGCANMAMGLLGVETKLQKERLIGLTREEAFEKFMDYTHWRSDAKLVKKYIDKSADTIEWLQEMGVEFALPSKYFPGSEATWHIVKPKTGNPGLRAAATMIKAMTERADELGVKILLETPVKSLIKEDGEVIGITANDKDGELEVYAGAVIISTGGFGDSPEFIKKYTPYEWGKDIFSYRIPGLTGDGIQMAWDAGAAKDYMSMELVFFAPNTGGYAPIELPFRQPNVFVNLDGKRFYNEEVVENPVFSVNAISRQKNRVAFSIIDDKLIKKYEENGLDLINVVTSSMDMSYFNHEKEEAIKNGSDVLFIADSIEELAEKTGIDKEGLKTTLESYNEACKTGDKDFGKNHKYMIPIDGSKLYALKFAPSAYGSLGGIKINDMTEVLTDEFKAISGLYAAGTDANSVCNPDYVFILPGNTLGFAVNSGRMAGNNAVEYIKTNLVEE